jgi:hypothetical protein
MIDSDRINLIFLRVVDAANDIHSDSHGAWQDICFRNGANSAAEVLLHVL